MMPVARRAGDAERVDELLRAGSAQRGADAGRRADRAEAPRSDGSRPCGSPSAPPRLRRHITSTPTAMPRSTSAPATLCRSRRRQHGRHDHRAGMHRPALERVVEILAMRGGAVDERGARRRRACRAWPMRGAAAPGSQPIERGAARSRCRARRRTGRRCRAAAACRPRELAGGIARRARGERSRCGEALAPRGVGVQASRAFPCAGEFAATATQTTSAPAPARAGRARSDPPGRSVIAAREQQRAAVVAIRPGSRARRRAPAAATARRSQRMK